MDGATVIQIRKRDGTVEDFSPLKLAGSTYRAIQPFGGRQCDAASLSGAVCAFLRRGGGARSISSAAVFEMVLKVMRRVGFFDAAEAMEVHHAWRQARRAKMRVIHDGGRVTAWEKAWLSSLAERGWHLSRTVARIIAGQIEHDLLTARTSVVTRAAALDMLNEHVAALGLADAVPVNQPAVE